MIELTLLIRFLLELVTAIGILSGTFLAKNITLKITFLILGILIIYLWSRYGAPKSPLALRGNKKLLLEIFVFLSGAISFLFIFNTKVSIIYTVLAVINLLAMYFLNLED